MHDVHARAKDFVRYLQEEQSPNLVTGEMIGTLAVLLVATDEEYNSFKAQGATEAQFEALIDRTVDELGIWDV